MARQLAPHAFVENQSMQANQYFADIQMAGVDCSSKQWTVHESGGCFANRVCNSL
jgi:hypothetical protein